MTAVYGGSTNAEDNTYAKATPSGELKLQIDNDGAKGILKPGVKVYVEITVIERGAAAHGVSSSIPNEPWRWAEPRWTQRWEVGVFLFAVALGRSCPQENFPMKDAVVTVLATIGGISVVICLCVIAAAVRGGKSKRPSWDRYDEDEP